MFKSKQPLLDWVGAIVFLTLASAASAYAGCDVNAAYDPNNPCNAPVNAPVDAPGVAAAAAAWTPPVQRNQPIITPSPGVSYGYTWKQCERRDLGGATFPFDANGNFEPQCAPDTLYTWQTPQAVQSLQWHATNDTPGQFDLKHTMFFWRTPMGSFGYNTQQIRIKLKPGTQFIAVDSSNRSCPINSATDGDSVYVSTVPWLDGWSEYILCSGGAVESWSTETPEGYREMQAETKWVQTHAQGQFDEIAHPVNGDSIICPTCALYQINIQDPNTDWTINRLDEDLQGAQMSLQQEGKGYVYYAPGTPHDRHRHFETDMPSYFNPIAATPED
jgi:hypothetical protein